MKSQDAFRQFDRNKDGFLSPAELMFVIDDLGYKLSANALMAMLAKIDTNQDGKIS